jgi:unsaturated rhamnogalacturonyl hydrolase
MNFKYLLLAVITTLSFSCKNTNDPGSSTEQDSVTIDSTLPEAVQMGQSILKNFPDLWSIEGGTKPAWSYTYGLVSLSMLKLWETTGDEIYYNYAKSYADQLIDSSGTIKGYEMEKYNIDKINSGKILFTFYQKTGDEKYKIAMDTLRQQLRKHPRTSVGGFWHKKRYPHQMWLDGLYMGGPFYARYGKEFDEPAAYDDVTNWYIQMEKVARDPVTGLLYHGWDESKEQQWASNETGLSQHFWGRGMGWYSMALVDVLDYIPEDHKDRQAIVDIIKRYAEAIVKYQHPQKGVWYQVLDQGDREGNYLEGSVSSMFTYFLFKAVDKGYIDAKFQENAKKAFEGTRRNLVKANDDGSLVITPVCAVAGLGGNPYRDGSYDYYINERKRDNDPKAVGPYIMAAIYYDKLKGEE